jgi:hypothetical protein
MILYVFLGLFIIIKALISSSLSSLSSRLGLGFDYSTSVVR